MRPLKIHLTSETRRRLAPAALTGLAFSLALGLALALAGTEAHAQAGAETQRVILKMHDGVEPHPRGVFAFHEAMNEVRVTRLSALGMVILEVPADWDPDALINALARDPAVSYGVRDQGMSVQQAQPTCSSPNTRCPNDPGYSNQRSALEEVNAPEAWNYTTGSTEVVIAVLDSGIDYTHRDLAGNMWVNETEARGEPGVDDDGNGVIDDIHGYDFTNGLPPDSPDGDPWDDNDIGHGTRVAGIIAAQGNNGFGVTGVAWNARLMAVKVTNHLGNGGLADILFGLDYVMIMKRRGVNILAANLSLGFVRPLSNMATAIVNSAIDDVQAARILLIVAAGNESTDLDSPPDSNQITSLAQFRQDNVIGVAGSDYAPTNFGRESVDLAAPGSDIYAPHSRIGNLDTGVTPHAGIVFDDAETDAGPSSSQNWTRAAGLPNSGARGSAWTNVDIFPVDTSPTAAAMAELRYGPFDLSAFANAFPSTQNHLIVNFRVSHNPQNLRLRLQSRDDPGGAWFNTEVSPPRSGVTQQVWPRFSISIPPRFHGSENVEFRFLITPIINEMIGRGSIYLDEIGIWRAEDIPGDTFNSHSGTSFATPFVSGAVALIASHRPDLNYRQIRSAILDNVRILTPLENLIVSGGILDLSATLEAATATTRADFIARGTVLPNRTLFSVESAPSLITFTLTRAPSTGIAIQLTTPGTDDINIQPATLRFTPDNWNLQQQTTITAGQNGISENSRSAVLRFEVITDASETIYVDDTGRSGITIFPLLLPIQLSRGTISLGEPIPAVAVVLNARVPRPIAATLTLTVDESARSSAYSIQVMEQIAQDESTIFFFNILPEPNITADVTARITVAAIFADTAEPIDPPTPAILTITPPAGRVIARFARNVAEGVPSLISIILSRAPSTVVTVQITTPGADDIGIQPATLRFTPDNWSTQSAVMTAGQNGLSETSRTATLRFDVITDISETVYNDAAAEFGITIFPLFGPIQLSPTIVSPGEATTATVVLNAPAPGAIAATLTLTVDESARSSAYSTEVAGRIPQGGSSITFTLLPEPDITADVTARVTLTAIRISTLEPIDPPPPATLTITPNLLLRLSTGITAVFERRIGFIESVPSPVTVTLDRAPSTAVAVRITAPEAAGIGIQPTTLTFTPDNWRSQQAVVLAAQDGESDPFRIAVLFFDVITDVSETVYVDDMDGIAIIIASLLRPIQLSRSMITSGEATTATVALNAPAPGAIAATLTLTVQEPAYSIEVAGQVAQGGNSITFRLLPEPDITADATARVTVAAIFADTAEPIDPPPTATLRITPVPPSESVRVRFERNITEGVPSLISVILSRAPSTVVTVQITTPGTDGISIQPATLRFTPDNWSTQSPVITAGQNGLSESSRTAVLRFDVITAASETVYIEGSAEFNINIFPLFGPIQLSRSIVSLGEAVTATVALNAPAPGAIAATLTLTVDETAGSSAYSTEVMEQIAQDERTITFNILPRPDITADVTARVTLTARRISTLEPIDPPPPATLTITPDLLLRLSTGITAAFERRIGFIEGVPSPVTVTLDRAPSTAVAVRITAPEAAGIGIQPTTLTFTPDNWRSRQQAVVLAAQDGESDPFRIAVLFFDVITDASETVYVDDADAIAIIIASLLRPIQLSPAIVSLGEATTATVALNAPAPGAIAATLTVTVDESARSSAYSTEVTGRIAQGGSSITFTLLPEPDITADVTARITLAAIFADTTEPIDPPPTATLRIIPEIITAFETSPENRAPVFIEGVPSPVTVSLPHAPSAGVAVRITAPGEGGISAQPTMLTFTPGNWNSPQQTLVFVAQNGLSESSRTAVLRFEVAAAASETAYIDAEKFIGITIFPLFGSIQPARDIVTSGGEITATVALNAPAPGAITATLTLAVQAAYSTEATEQIAQGGNSITFTLLPEPGITAPIQARVTLTAIFTDGGGSIDSPPPAPLTVTPTPLLHLSTGVTAAFERRTSTENPTPAFIEGVPSPVTVTLARAPGAAVAVRITAPESTGVSVQPTTLRFTPGNWRSQQQTVVLVAQNGLSERGRTAALRFDVIPDALETIYAGDTSATDINIFPLLRSVHLNRAFIILGEATTATVALNAPAPGAVAATLTLTVDESAHSPAYSTDVMVRIAQGGNSIAFPLLPEPDITAPVQARITLRAARTDTAEPIDPPPPATLMIIPGVITAFERRTSPENRTPAFIEGVPSTVTVILPRIPSAAVAVRITASGSTGISVQPTTLTFTPGNWDSQQEAVVLVAQNGLSENSRTAALHFSVITDASETVYVDTTNSADINIFPLFGPIHPARNAITLGEATTATVALNAPAPEPVAATLTLTVDESARSSAYSTEVTGRIAQGGSSITFTLLPEPDITADATARITLAAIFAGTAEPIDPPPPATLRIIPEIITAFETSPENRAPVFIEGVPSPVTVSLPHTPSAGVAVRITAPGEGGISAQPTMLTFTPGNWNSPQQTLVLVAQNGLSESSRTAVLRFEVAAASSETAYIDAEKFIGITIFPLFGAIQPARDIVTSGGEITATVALNAPAPGTITATLTLAVQEPAYSTEVAGQIAQGGNSITFTLLPEPGITAPVQARVTLTAIFTDGGGSIDSPQPAPLTVTPTPLLHLSTGVTAAFERGIVFIEGVPSPVTVTLDRAPSTAVTVRITAPEAAGIGIQPATLRFTPDNWRSQQQAVVLAAQNGESEPFRTTTLFFNVITDVSETVYVDDTDGIAIIISSLLRPIQLSRSMITSGEATTATVALNAPAPRAIAATLTLTVQEPAYSTEVAGQVAQGGNSITFRLLPEPDITADATARITLAAIFADTAEPIDPPPPATLRITPVPPSESVRVRFERNITEGVPSLISVILSRAPSTVVTVQITTPGTDDISIQPATLRFTPDNWSTQSPVITAGQNGLSESSRTAVLRFEVITAASETVYIEGSAEFNINIFPLFGPIRLSRSIVSLGEAVTATVALNAPAPGAIAATLTLTVQEPAYSTEVAGQIAQDEQTITFNIQPRPDITADVTARVTLTAIRISTLEPIDPPPPATLTITPNLLLHLSTGITAAFERRIGFIEGVPSPVTVTLDRAPSTAVAVRITAPEAAGIGIQPTTLTFTPDNWRSRQQAVVLAAQDGESDPFRIAVLFFDVITDDSETVYVDDADAIAIIIASLLRPIQLSPTIVSLGEATTATVALNAPAPGPVAATLTLTVDESARSSAYSTEVAGRIAQGGSSIAFRLLPEPDITAGVTARITLVAIFADTAEPIDPPPPATLRITPHQLLRLRVRVFLEGALCQIIPEIYPRCKKQGDRGPSPLR